MKYKKGSFSDIIKYILVAAFTVCFYFLVQNLGQFQNLFTYVTNITKPIIIGFAIAFVLNILMRKIENKIFIKLFKNNKFLYKKKRILSLLLTIIITFFFLIGSIAFLIPQLSSSLSSLSEDLPTYAQATSNILNNLLKSLDINSDVLNKIIEVSSNLIVNLAGMISNFVMSIIPDIINIISNTTSLIINLLLSFILAIYMLLDKENLIKNIKRVLKVFLPQNTFEYIIDSGMIVNRCFTSFISGQIMESIILGILCFIGMTIFSFPFAFLISFIIGITCLIPYFGAFIGTIPAFLIIFITDAQQGLWFLLFAICLQQIEGNLIYPRVVGNSIGLPTIFVSIALIVGGNMFGFLGMILGVPTFASMYFLFKDYIAKKEQEKNAFENDVKSNLIEVTDDININDFNIKDN